MRALFVFIAPLFLFPLLPVQTHAESIGSCEEGTLKCVCMNDGDSYTSVQSITEQSCSAFCKAVREGTDPSVIGYYFQCVIGGNITAIAGARFDQSDNSSSLNDNEESTDEPDEPLPNALIPRLSIQIPGLNFENAVSGEVGDVRSNLIAQYISAIYRFLLGLAALIAVLVMMIAGVEWMTAAGNASQVARAKKRIGDAVVGIVLLFGAYTISYLIDPATTIFEPLVMQSIERQEFEGPEGEHWAITPREDIPPNVQALESNEHLVVQASDNLANYAVIHSLNEAAKQFHAETGNQIIVKSASRTVRRQAELFYDHCIAKGGICNPPTCNPAPSAPFITRDGNGKYTFTGYMAGMEGNKTLVVNELTKFGKIGNCPHTSSIAIDAWCPNSYDFTYDPACQTILAQKMIEQGFCRLQSEPWHFEFDQFKVSRSTCSKSYTTSTYTKRGASVTPPTTCKRWAYKTGTCIQ